MASVVWNSIFVVLVVEVVLVFLLLLPVPPRWKRSVVDWASGSSVLASLRPFRIGFYLLCLALFAESVRQMNFDSSAVASDATQATFQRAQLLRFRAQRNVYITFFALFFVYVIDRVAAIIVAHAKAEMHVEVVKKQAKQNSAALSKLAGERDELREEAKQNAEVVKGAGAEKAKAAQLLKQAENQQQSFVQLVEELTSVKNKHKAVVEDNEQLKERVEKLTDRNKSLQGVVDDYEAVMGDKMKKKK